MPGKVHPPKPVKGRTFRAATLGPWAQLIAMRRMQSGEPVAYIAASLGISIKTLNRWHRQWGDDVAHIVAHADVAALRRATAALITLERNMLALWTMLQAATKPKTHTAVANMHATLADGFAYVRQAMAQVTGDGHRYFQQRRMQAEDKRPQVLAKSCSRCGANPTPTLDKSAVYWR